MGSSRLPGKVLMTISGQSMLEKIIRRVSRSLKVDGVVLATTTDRSDDPLEKEALRLGVDVVRGPELDVLARFGLVLDKFPSAKYIVRITADCPFVDPEIIDELVNLIEAKNLDFVSNRLPPPWQRTFPLGLDVEVCSAKALDKAITEANKPFQREHVMPFLYDPLNAFKIEIINLDIDQSHHRWTVDTPTDLQVVRELDRLVGDEPFGWADVLNVAIANPSVDALNVSELHKRYDEVDKRWDS